jgi:hypothetical protein
LANAILLGETLGVLVGGFVGLSINMSKIKIKAFNKKTRIYKLKFVSGKQTLQENKKNIAD